RTDQRSREPALLLLRRGFCCRTLFGSLSLLLCRWLCSLRFSFRLGSSFLLRLHFFFRKLGSGEFLAVKGNLGYPHRGKRLPMSGKFLVLLLFLVVENQNFLGSAFVQDFSRDQRALCPRNLSVARRYRQHITKFDLAVLFTALGFQANHIPGCYPILLSTGANDRVHSLISMRPHRGTGLSSNFPQRTSDLSLTIFMLAVSAPSLRQRWPQNWTSTGKLNHFK